MVCLFHGDYGPPDSAFHPNAGLTWIVDANSLKDRSEERRVGKEC